MSKSSPPSPTDLAGIAAAADAAEADAEAADTNSRIFSLEEKLASIEPLLEQLQANSQIGPKLTEYVEDLRSEQVFFNCARYVVGFSAILVVGGLIALMCAAIFDARSPLLSSPPLTVVAFVIGMVTSITVILNSFTRGVFRSTAERHADGFLPPALEKAVELLGKVSGKP